MCIFVNFVIVCYNSLTPISENDSLVCNDGRGIDQTV